VVAVYVITVVAVYVITVVAVYAITVVAVYAITVAFLVYFNFALLIATGRGHCATSWKVAGSIPDGAFAFFFFQFT
jgi:hypothetical protein